MSDQLPTYRVNVFFGEDEWVAVVEDLGVTQCPHFSLLEDFVSDYIAGMTDTDLGEFWIDWNLVQGSRSLAEALQDLRRWEQETRVIQVNRDRLRRVAIEGLQEAGLSYRQIADAIGVSYQRVGQLLKEPGGTVSTIDVAWVDPALSVVVDLKHERSDHVRPTDAALAWVVDNVMREHPARRREMLRESARVLERVAEDEEFLRSGEKTRSA
jgi:hypothetical protein